MNPTDTTQTLPHAFIDRRGKVDVRIYIANQTIDHRKELDIKIAFTAFHSKQYFIASFFYLVLTRCVQKVMGILIYLERILFIRLYCCYPLKMVPT